MDLYTLKESQTIELKEAFDRLPPIYSKPILVLLIRVAG